MDNLMGRKSKNNSANVIAMLTTELETNFITVTEFARLTGFTTGRIRQKLRSGDIPGQKLTALGPWVIDKALIQHVATVLPKTGRPRSGKPKI
jgi:hypothetical protein